MAKQILMLTDDPLLGGYLSRELQSWGTTVVICPTVRLFSHALLELNFDLIVILCSKEQNVSSFHRATAAVSPENMQQLILFTCNTQVEVLDKIPLQRVVDLTTEHAQRIFFSEAKNVLMKDRGR